MINIDDRILAEVDENQLFLLCAIAKHMGENTKAWPSNRTLCETTRWSPNKLQRVKKSAIEAGILGAESRFQKAAQTSNLYQIKTRRIGVMVNLADITPHPPNGVSPHPQNGVSPHPQNGVTEVLTNEVLTNEREGERNTPAPNPSNLQSQKNESGFVAPGENPETVKAEIPPLPKVAPKGIPPEDEKEICRNCGGDGYDPYPNHSTTPAICPCCVGTGFEIQTQFRVTAIASQSSIPGVTLVEAAPARYTAPQTGKPIHQTHPLRYDECPLPRNANELKNSLTEYFRQHDQDWRLLLENARVKWDAEKVSETVLAYCLHQEKEGNMKRTYATYKAGLTTWFMRQKSYDAQNAPREGGATRNGTQQQTTYTAPKSVFKASTL